MTNAWEKTGRDAAHEDIAGGAEPCTTLDEARRRIGQWLRSQTPAVAAADAEACAAAYLRAWEAHARDTSPAGLDLDAIEMRSRDNEDFRTYHLAQDSAADVPALLARVRDLTAKFDAAAQAYDDLVAQVWRATGETHEPPADVEALLARVADDHKALVGFRRAMLDVHEALDGVRPEPDFDMPAELGSYACDEVARLQESRDALRAEVRQLRAAALHRRREGAEAMREACAAEADHFAGESVAAYIRALPLPEGEP